MLCGYVNREKLLQNENKYVTREDFYILYFYYNCNKYYYNYYDIIIIILYNIIGK